MIMTTNNYTYKYPRPAVTTDCVVFAEGETGVKVLLIERGGEPFMGSWALPGGFLNPDENADEDAKRELLEETGIDVDNLKQFHTYSQPGRDPRGWTITVAYMAVVPLQKVKAGDDARRAEWFGIDNLPALAFDHAEIIGDAIKLLNKLK